MTGGLGWQCGAALNIELVETGHWTRGGLDDELVGDWTLNSWGTGQLLNPHHLSSLAHLC